MDLNSADIDLVTEAAQDIPVVAYPGGWHGQIEVALIDAVLSIRARYGTPETGVRAAIKRYRDQQAREVLDDLDALKAVGAVRLADVLQNRQKTGGVLKSLAIVDAAEKLTAAGVRSASDLDPVSEEQRAAYTGVTGLGEVTWEYFCMNLGWPGIKADTWICRFVARAIHGEVTSVAARRLLMAAADRLRRDPIELDHSVWVFMSNGG